MVAGLPQLQLISFQLFPNTPQASELTAGAHSITQRFPVEACSVITSWEIVALNATLPDCVGALFLSDS
jgi:hypothetical protein